MTKAGISYEEFRTFLAMFVVTKAGIFNQAFRTFLAVFLAKKSRYFFNQDLGTILSCLQQHTLVFVDMSLGHY